MAKTIMQEDMDSYLDILHEFELKKRSFDGKKVTIKLPSSVFELIERKKGSFEDAVSACGLSTEMVGRVIIRNI